MEKLVVKIGEVLSRLNVLGTDGDFGQPNFTPYREFERFCNQLVFESDDDLERFSAFWFSRYFANFFENLGGDALYDDNLRLLKIKIYIHLAESFNKIKNSLDKRNTDEIMAIFSDIVKVYAGEINHLNSLF